MSAVTGIIGGALGLASLQLVLSSPTATSAFGKVATLPASWIEKFMDPHTPLIPDRSVAGAPASSSSAGAAYPTPGSVPAPSSPQTLSV